MTSPFDRPLGPLQNPAWQPMVDGVGTLAAAVAALVIVVEKLVALVDELRKLIMRAYE